MESASTPRTEPPISQVLTPVDFPRTFSAAFTALSWSAPHREMKVVTTAFAIQLERELSAATAELAATKAKLDFLKSKGLTVGMMKTSDKPEPYLVYVIEPESELCNLELVHKLIDADIERDRTKEQLRVAREAISDARNKFKHYATLHFMKDTPEGDAKGRQNELMAEKMRDALTLTQPNLSADSLGGGNPAKGEGGVPLTFPA